MEYRERLQKCVDETKSDVPGTASDAGEARRRVRKVPVVACVDLPPKGGELAYDLIDDLTQQRMPVIVASGSVTLPERLEEVVAILEKPFKPTMQ